MMLRQGLITTEKQSGQARGSAGRGDLLFPLVGFDAVGINQSDFSEWGHQVQYMRTIHQNTLAVSAWLGEAEDDTHLAMQLIEEIRVEDFGEKNGSDERLEDVSRKVDIDFDSNSWKALLKFSFILTGSTLGLFKK
jgi:hypothetical protein